MPEISKKKFSKLVYVITSCGNDPPILEVITLQRQNSEVAMLKQHQAELIIEVRDDGRTEVVKNRFGQTGQVRADSPPANVEEIQEDLKKFLGLAPYNDMSNHCWGDTYFGHALERRYGRPIKELRSIAGL